MLRQLSDQGAMSGFEDDEVIRVDCISRVENTQTDVPSSGGGSTEGTGRQRDEGREGYNFLSNSEQFPIHCILMYFVLYSAVF